jgi:predicted RNA-binding protein with PUA-like domain
VVAGETAIATVGKEGSGLNYRGYSIHDLAAEPNQTTHWDGVRNYQARNLMRDEMKIGDGVLFYHSNAKPPAVAGTATVCGEAYPDFTAWEKGNSHFDAKASPQNPIWQMVDIELADVFDEPIGLPELREVKALAKMMLLQRGSRLSVQPVTKSEFNTIVKLAMKKAAVK